ncbi:MAG: DUF2283 domain-containing protein [Leptolyngbyaceae bacterium]|nr:DUF2283 domain-containing protein [Leptolyngbyaceae bacterium]
MKIIYDERADILQIRFVERCIEETAQIAPGFILDYDEDGRVIGLELRKASQRVDDPKTVLYAVDEADLDKPRPKTDDAS